jgi:hypothetical protein
MTAKMMTAKFGLLDFEKLATAQGQAEVEKRMAAERASEYAPHAHDVAHAAWLHGGESYERMAA